ncbi:hypothetical protein O181_031524 [Austropuccinia psidii MF-1]|uniref:Uncharacterized protein n=1 Tax=Austropuccinia psidii MF-1 TaxID=1389203 RepID=A0A9Q3CVW4_9BASI|nr:hypothetical protein [Austropuccinia psidii MF-1]
MVELTSFASFDWDFLVIDTPKGEEPELEFDFFNHYNPSVDRRQGLIIFDADYKDYHNPSESSSNAFFSDKECASVVVFKQIQVVGEDNCVSSLNLSLENVDLPPSSYHFSVKEFWDGKEDPEEIETIMKVVPSAYNHYLDVLSKVKAEKLPAHCACDYHIKLKGSLPPVGVIYSLLNPESDTIRA